MSFTPVHRRAWLSEHDCDLADFREVVERTTDLADHPYASSVERNVLIYDSDRLRKAEDSRAVRAELVRALTDGPGIVVFKGAFPDTEIVDRLSAVFDALIAEQRASGASAGDHFAKPGANDRVWNALEKAALYDPEAFADYYANDILALVSRAWLGPGYQVTSQVNVVNPGGAAQTVHRDYHLGFLSNEVAAAFPAHVHVLSPVLTLQGAVAHCDMPVQSGPTMYLPYSQRYEPGYLAWRLPEFQEYFEAHHVQLSSPRATRPSSTRRCSTRPAPTGRRTSGGWRTSSRCPPRSAGRWRRWTARPSRTPSTPCCWRARAWTRRGRRTSSQRAPRATPSPRTSTATHRSTAWPRPPRRTSYGARCARHGLPRLCGTSCGPAPSGARAERTRKGMGLLDDKVVLVNGGSQGVGAAIARAAVREGAVVAVTGRRTEPGEALVAELAAAGGKALFVRADLSDAEQAKTSVAEVVDAYGRVDCMVNSAGLTSRGTLLDTTPELFDQHIAINLKAPFFAMQAAVQDMIARKAPGTIVNIITSSAHGGQPFLAPYVSAKAGLIGLTRNAAHAHRWDRVRINGLNIGWTATEGEDATQKAFHGADDGWRESAAAGLPMGKLGQPDEIADFVVFLLSERSGVVTGSVIDWDQNVLGGLD